MLPVFAFLPYAGTLHVHLLIHFRRDISVFSYSLGNDEERLIVLVHTSFSLLDDDMVQKKKKKQKKVLPFLYSCTLRPFDGTVTHYVNEMKKVTK